MINEAQVVCPYYSSNVANFQSLIAFENRNFIKLMTIAFLSWLAIHDSLLCLRMEVSFYLHILFSSYPFLLFIEPLKVFLFLVREP